jgi:hypothetical protein
MSLAEWPAHQDAVRSISDDAKELSEGSGLIQIEPDGLERPPAHDGNCSAIPHKFREQIFIGANI